jgi:uncharacterized membrane protein
MKGVSMSIPTNIGTHPVHPILVSLPIGLWTFSVVADLVFYLGWGGAIWKDVAFYTLGGGIVGAVLAAVPGLIDFLTITDARARQAGLVHLVSNIIALVVFGVSFWLRWIATVGVVPTALSLVGLVALGVAGWFGGELVFVHNMGVTPPKGTRAKASTSHRRIA